MLISIIWTDPDWQEQPKLPFGRIISMPFPDIKNCLICEEVRLERRKLSSLLGFYGLTPDVEILVKDFNMPVERISFVMLGKGEGGRAQVSFRIQDDTNNIILNSTPIETEILNPTGGQINYAIGVRGIKFPHAGTYRFILLISDKIHYETSFQVRQGGPDDFA